MSMHISPRHAGRGRNRGLRMRFGMLWGFVLVAAIVAVSGFFYLSSRTTETCTVESKERTTHVNDGKSTQQKLVYTDECGVLTVDDNFFLGKFNSADTYGKLKEGKTYEIESVGWRNGFFSWYPNVLTATEIRS